MGSVCQENLTYVSMTVCQYVQIDNRIPLKSLQYCQLVAEVEVEEEQQEMWIIITLKRYDITF